ncbi:MAG: hypothetical protein ACKOET_16555, partial [Verrucomicrobiota bacterium]
RFRLEYVYDGKLRLRERRYFTWLNGTWYSSATDRYVYDGMLVVQERSTTAPTVSYTRGVDLSGGLDGAGGIGGLLARSHGFSSGTGAWSAHTAYHADGNGNVTALFSTSTGSQVGWYRYDAFGRLLLSSCPNSMETDNASPRGSGSRRCFAWGVAGLLAGILVGILIIQNRSSTEDPGSYTLNSDNNGDGNSDATFHYERGVVTRAEHDRNFDGKPDLWEWYDSGVVSRGETDDNFDGKIDGWSDYQYGNWWISKHDTDKNGVPDLFQHFEHGVIKLAVWRPNQATKPIRIEFYEGGVLRKERSDTDKGGLLETIAYFDLFANQTSTEKLPEPLQPDRAISGP